MYGHTYLFFKVHTETYSKDFQTLWEADMNPTSHKSLHLPTWPLTIISQPESVQSSLVQIRLEHTLSIALLDIVDTTTPREKTGSKPLFVWVCYFHF